MDHLLPYWKNRNIRVFYILSILTNTWFVLPNWMFLYGLYLTKQQIGFVEAAAIILGILIEVPTGIISDIFGKKTTLIIGNAAIALSAYIVTQAHDFPMFLLGNCLVFVGFAFNSGSYEAFAYDSLVDIEKQGDYDKVISKSTALILITSCVTIFAGGLLFAINPTYPFYAWFITSALAALVLFFATEPRMDSQHVSFSSYFEKLKDGVSTIFSNKFSAVLFPILAAAAIAKLNQGVVRQSMAVHFGFNGETFAYILALSTVPAIFIAHKFEKILQKAGAFNLLFGLLGSFALLFFFGAKTYIPAFGTIYFVLYMIIERLSGQINSVASNERIASGHRATALSVIALLSQIPYVVLMFFFSDFTSLEKIPLLMMFFGGVAALAAFYSFYSLIWNKK